MPPLSYWSVPTLWPGETAFIIGGGPSVLAHDVSRLRGRRVIAINASYRIAPFADFLIFTDIPFYDNHRDEIAASFHGRVVAVNDLSEAPPGRELLRLKRRRPDGLTSARDTVGVEYTTYTAAIDLAVLLGAARIVTLGLDGKPAADGRTHHHEPHADCTHIAWQAQKNELGRYAAALKQRALELVNASPGSAIPFWPIVPTLERYL